MHPMPNSIAIHRDPLSANMIETDWLKANRAEPKPKPVENSKPTGCVLQPPFLQESPSLEFTFRRNNHPKHNTTATTTTRATSHNKQEKRTEATSHNSRSEQVRECYIISSSHSQAASSMPHLHHNTLNRGTSFRQRVFKQQSKIRIASSLYDRLGRSSNSSYEIWCN